MKAYCDLHIHSCLSPCCDDEMTPWNLVGMAKVKGLDVIALTDHNSALNVPAALAAAQAYGVQVIPGMEITTREEVHLLAYFVNAESALAFGEEIYAHLPNIANRETLFGNQLIIGPDDEPTGKVEKLLLNATDLSLEEARALTEKYGGVNVPAHINRGSNGMLGALGMMPPLPDYPVVEVAPQISYPELATRDRIVVYSSDAHRLVDIAERDFSLEVPAISAQAVVDWLKNARGKTL
jgi:3',5'-nucleoside bisphosphate phosphatase